MSEREKVEGQGLEHEAMVAGAAAWGERSAGMDASTELTTTLQMIDAANQWFRSLRFGDSAPEAGMRVIAVTHFVIGYAFEAGYYKGMGDGMSKYPRCRLCGSAVNTDSPYVGYDANPETFRRGWMHDECYLQALEELKGKPAKAPGYLDEHDRYITVTAGE